MTLRAKGTRFFLRQGDSSPWQPLGKEIVVSLTREGGASRLAINGELQRSVQVRLQVGSGTSDAFEYEGTSHRGEVIATASKGELFLVNAIPVEEYLLGTLPGEMSPQWDRDILKAQAVASRTYAFYMMRYPRHRLYDLVGTIHDQVYDGLGRRFSSVNHAVLSTVGQFLSMDGRPIKAYFHARCGGTTETPDVVWNSPKEPRHRRVPCPYCRAKPMQWRARVPVEVLSRILSPTSRAEPPRLSVSGKTPSGRIHSLRIDIGDDVSRLSSETFRRLVGYGRIQSALFDWRMEGGEILFRGVGAGHGVGMCQWGGRHLAQQGRNYREILAHYYPHAALDVVNSPRP